MLPGGRSLRVVVGEPQRGVRRRHRDRRAQAASPLRPETYLYGCPVLSSDGRELLYESVDDAGAHQILYSHSPDGEGGPRADQGHEPGVDPEHRGLRDRSRPHPRGGLFDPGHELERGARRFERAAAAGGEGGLGARQSAGAALPRRARREPVRGPLVAGSRDAGDVLARRHRRATFASTAAPTTSRSRSTGPRATRCSRWSTGAPAWRAITRRCSTGILRDALTDGREHDVPAVAPPARRRVGVRGAEAPPRRLTADGSNDNVARSAVGAPVDPEPPARRRIRDHAVRRRGAPRRC